MEIFYVFAVITILGLIGYAFQIFAVRASSFLHSGEGDYLPRTLPPVSILKPLKGLDDNLFDNLESFCVQDYPEYEIIFSLQDQNDPAHKVAQKIKDKYLDKDISIKVERCNAGLNPKVNNLIPAYKSSKYKLILISDSNVMVDKNYLRSIVRYMEDPEVGLVSNTIRGVGGHSFGSIFENLHLNTFVLSSVCFLDKFLKMPCVVGKSMLMRKSDLDAIGGFKAVKDVLAEDYIIGKKMHKGGKKVILSGHMIKNVNEYWSIKKFLNRHTRWAKLRWKIGGFRYISEIISNPVFMSWLPVFLWEPSEITISFAFSVSFIKITGDYYLGKRIGSGARDKGSSSLAPWCYLLSPAKDLIIGLIWFVPLFSNTVLWRGNRYLIGKDSVLSPCPDTGMWSWRYRVFDAIRARLA
jgi:ceramide glucosyltransferase